MINEQTIQTQNESQFRDIAFRVLKEVGFEPYSREKTADRPQAEAGHMKKDGQSYLVETFHSRRAQPAALPPVITSKSFASYKPPGFFVDN